jgi:hypothetical protein
MAVMRDALDDESALVRRALVRQLLEVDPTRCEVGFQVANTGPDEALAPVSELAGAPKSGVVAAALPEASDR